MTFTAFGRDFRAQLSRNRAFEKLGASSSVQLYKGTLDGVPGSWVRITMQDGLPRGLVWDGKEMFVVDAAPDGVNEGAHGTVMYKLADAVLERSISLDGDAVEVPRDAAQAYDELVKDMGAQTQALEAGVPTQVVEVSILADAAVLARFNGEAQARDAILTRLNNVDGIFSAQLGVELRVASLEIGGELTAGLTATTDPSTLLEELSQLRSRIAGLRATGVTHLFTGRDLNGNTAGIAYTLALCSRRYASSLTMFHTSVALDTLMAAHEIGHVFGAPHDGVEKCAATPQRQFIMTPSLDTSVTSFSQCSLDQMNAVLASYSCVADLPPPQPAEPAPPTGDGDGGEDPGDGDGNGSGTGGNEGGGGFIDVASLAVLFALWLSSTLAMRVPRIRKAS